MLKHRYIVAVYVLLMFLPFVSDYFENIPVYYFALITFIFLGIEFYGAYFIHSNFHLKAICKGRTLNHQVAITFDDGPSEETSSILDVLKEFKTPATFFLIGNKISSHPEIVKRIDSEGHVIGNHSYSHGFFIDFQLTKGFIEEIEQANKEIEKVIGKKPLFFRPPYGVTTPSIGRAIKKLNMHAIGWNIRSLDTSIADKKEVLKRIQKRVQPGSIILLHDTLKTNANLVRELIQYLHQQQYEIVSLDQLIQKKAYA